MYRVRRKHQRKVIRSEAYESHSYLIMPREGSFEAFGGLTCCLETIHRSGFEIRRGPFLQTVMLVVMLEGILEVGRQRVPLGAGQVAKVVPGDGEMIVYSTPAHSASRYLEIGFQSPGGSPAVEVGKAQLQRDLPHPIFLVLAGSEPEPESLTLEPDYTVYWGRLRSGENLIFETTAARSSFLLVLRGTVRAAEERLLAGDCAFLSRETSVSVFAPELAELLLIDLAAEPGP